MPRAWHDGVMKRACVYILASKRNGTLYVGVTSDIARRTWEHKSGVVAGFTQKYSVHLLVYVEFHETMRDAIAREKQIKKWNRIWKPDDRGEESRMARPVRGNLSVDGIVWIPAYAGMTE